MTLDQLINSHPEVILYQIERMRHFMVGRRGDKPLYLWIEMTHGDRFWFLIGEPMPMDFDTRKGLAQTRIQVQIRQQPNGVEELIVWAR